MRKLPSSLYRDILFGYKATLQNNYMDMSRLMVYMQLVEDEKKKQTKIRKSLSKKFRYFERGGGKQNSNIDGKQWSKKKWGKSGSYSRTSAPYPKPFVIVIFRETGGLSYKMSNLRPVGHSQLYYIILVDFLDICTIVFVMRGEVSASDRSNLALFRETIIQEMSLLELIRLQLLHL